MEEYSEEEILDEDELQEELEYVELDKSEDQFTSKKQLYMDSNYSEELENQDENNDQDIYVSDILQTGRIMAKNEDLCLHCGLCAERCPTSAWDMQKYLFNTAKAENACQS